MLSSFLKGDIVASLRDIARQRAACLLVELMGLEPMTSCMPCKRSSQLSYNPTYVILAPLFGTVALCGVVVDTLLFARAQGNFNEFLRTAIGNFITALKILLNLLGCLKSLQSHSRPRLRMNFGARGEVPERKSKAPPTPTARRAVLSFCRFLAIHIS